MSYKSYRVKINSFTIFPHQEIWHLVNWLFTGSEFYFGAASRITACCFGVPKISLGRKKPRAFVNSPISKAAAELLRTSIFPHLCWWHAKMRAQGWTGFTNPVKEQNFLLIVTVAKCNSQLMKNLKVLARGCQIHEVWVVSQFSGTTFHMRLHRK